MAIKANYETVMVISMKRGEESVRAIIDKIKALIEKHATLQNVDEWGKRRLAYLINKESEGYYVLMNFESEADFPAELDRIYKITDGIMRSLIIKRPNGAPVIKKNEETAEKADEPAQTNEEVAEIPVVEVLDEASQTEPKSEQETE